MTTLNEMQAQLERMRAEKQRLSERAAADVLAQAARAEAVVAEALSLRAEVDRLRAIVNSQKADGGWRAHKRRLQAELRTLRFEFGKVCAERDAAKAENKRLRQDVVSDGAHPVCSALTCSCKACQMHLSHHRETK